MQTSPVDLSWLVDYSFCPMPPSAGVRNLWLAPSTKGAAKSLQRVTAAQAAAGFSSRCSHPACAAPAPLVTAAPDAGAGDGAIADVHNIYIRDRYCSARGAALPNTVAKTAKLRTGRRTRTCASACMRALHSRARPTRAPAHPATYFLTSSRFWCLHELRSVSAVVAEPCSSPAESAAGKCSAADKKAGLLCLVGGKTRGRDNINIVIESGDAAYPARLHPARALHLELCRRRRAGGDAQRCSGRVNCRD